MKIKNVAILKNVIEYNRNHDKDYLNKKGIMAIELDDNSRHILDLESMTDLTGVEYIEVKIIPNRTKIEYLFQNELYKETLGQFNVDIER